MSSPTFTSSCSRCRAVGRESRLIYTKAKGRGGKYHEYYFCRSRQDHLCDLPHLPLDVVEDAVEATYARIQLGGAFVTDMNKNVDAILAEEQTTTENLRASITKQLKDLDLQADRLLDLAADGTLPQDKIKSRLRKITTSRTRLKAELANADSQLATGAERLRDSLALARLVGDFYAEAEPATKRMLVQTFHEALYLDERGTAGDSPIRPPYDELYVANREFNGSTKASSTKANRTATTTRNAPGTTARGVNTKRSTTGKAHSDTGSSKTVMVGVTGIEPVTARV